MPVKYQFNKTSMQVLQKQLKVRLSALPTLKSKEAALRSTMKKQKEEMDVLKSKLDREMGNLQDHIELWSEFPFEIFSLKQVGLKSKKVAGVANYELQNVDYGVRDISTFMSPAWVPQGVEVLKRITELIAAVDIMEENMNLLMHARRKTTQKVNLYEKVQIPEYENAIQRIKRYLEDVENLEKAAQKITKQKFLA